jgi:hypothetical protein
MACPPTNVKFQFRRDDAINWTNYNPTLYPGEPGFEQNTNKLKIGTGLSWNATPYLGDLSISQIYAYSSDAESNLLNYDIIRVNLIANNIDVAGNTIHLPVPPVEGRLYIRIQNLKEHRLYVNTYDNIPVCIMYNELVNFSYRSSVEGWIYIC